MSEIVVTKAIKPSKSILEQVECIYNDNFPANERTPFEELVDMISSGKRRLYIAMDGTDIVAFGLIAFLAQVNLFYIAYMAVDASKHSKGIGSALFEGMTRSLKSSQEATGIVFEVESDIRGNEEELKIKRRRIRFYLKNGSQLLNVPSYQIPLFASDISSIPALLMWYPFDKNEKRPSVNSIKHIIAAIYEEEFTGFKQLCEQIIAAI